MHWIPHDGGRAAAGLRGTSGDCVCRAIAIAAELPYTAVADLITLAASQETPTRRRKRRSSARSGVYRPTTRRILEALGWTWVPGPAHLRAEELPPGRLIVQVSKHMAAVIDGVLYDTHDCSRKGTRCVMGWYFRPSA